MIRTCDRAVGFLRGRCADALRCASLAACLAFAVAAPAFSDVVELKNGELIKCKVVKEMQDLIKVRMPHRGKIVTTFFNKGSVKSVSRSSDVDNRQFFQTGGVHNPGRAYEPVYFSGSASGVSGAKPGKGPGVKGKAKGETAGRKRGLDARRERSESRAKERGDRFGQRASKGAKGGKTGIGSTTGSGGSSSPSSPASPSTSSSSGSSMSIGQ